MYDTPYGKKSGRLLMLAMEAHTRDEMAAELIRKAVLFLPYFEARQCKEWLDRREEGIARVSERIDTEAAMP